MKWLLLVLGISSVFACEIGDDDDDDPGRGDAAQARDGAVGRDASSPGDGAVARDTGTRDEDSGSDERDEDAGGSGPMVDCDTDNGAIDLPPGFCAVVFANGLGRARHLAVTPAGDLYVAVANSLDGSTLGSVVALRDSDGDLRADRVERFGDAGGNGVLWQDGKLFFAQNDRVERYDLPSGELVPAGEPVTVVRDLPITGDHYAKSIVLKGSDLYVNIGSATNSCQQVNRTLESPGIDPCTELDTRAGVWRFNAALVEQAQADGARFVRGARNLTAIALNPDDSAMYAVNNGRDQLYENWPSLYTMLDDQRLPSEELFRVVEGNDYGWPYCYYDELLGRAVLAPEYGGDGVMVGRCADLDDPLTVYPAHWAALGMVFYDEAHFPARYRGGAFIAFHGSRFEPQAPTDDVPGYNVVFQPFLDGSPNGAFEEFAVGFAGDARPLPEQAAHRPVGLAVAPDGSLYIGDDVGGRIWRVFYVGQQ
jgi:glucose/arabinose dehydrogenase